MRFRYRMGSIEVEFQATDTAAEIAIVQAAIAQAKAIVERMHEVKEVTQ